jgi:hypothetical protein
MQAYVDLLFDDWQGPVVVRPGPAHAAMTYVYCHAGVFHDATGVQALLADGTLDEVFYYKTLGAVIDGHAASRDRLLSYLCTADTPELLAQKLTRAEVDLKIINDQGHDIRWRGASLESPPEHLGIEAT